MVKMMNLAHYRYKLNENHKGHDSTAVEGITLSRDWTYIVRREKKLEPYVRTFKNSEGIIDMQKVIPSPLQILEDPLVNPETKFLDVQDSAIMFMDRKELIEIAKSMGLKTGSVVNSKLKRDIIEKKKKLSSFSSSLGAM